MHVEVMVRHYRALRCNVRLKLRFFHFHLDYFPQNLGDASNEQGERLHQDFKDMELRYQGY